MLAGMVYTELLKLKRTILPWIVALGGILPACIALLMVSSENSKVTWELLAVSSLNYMNMSALLLIAVFIGLIFAGEYNTNTISILFTYPVSRFRFYIGKLITILIVVIVIYLVLFISTLAFGIAGVKNFPSGEFLVKFFKFSLVVAVLNFVFVPVTVLACNLVKGVATSVVTGMCYVLVYMCFLGSDSGLYIPVCTPSMIISNSFVSNSINATDSRSIILIAGITFLISFLISAVNYSNSDIYR